MNTMGQSCAQPNRLSLGYAAGRWPLAFPVQVLRKHVLQLRIEGIDQGLRDLQRAFYVRVKGIG